MTVNNSVDDKCVCPKPDTHPLGYTIIMFIISLLWLRISGSPVFPVGFVLSLIMSYWHKSIEDEIYGRNHLVPMILVSIFGSLIGVSL